MLEWSAQKNGENNCTDEAHPANDGEEPDASVSGMPAETQEGASSGTGLPLQEPEIIGSDSDGDTLVW